MSESLSLVIQLVDGSHRAKVTLPGSLTVEQIIQKAQEKWNLPIETSYAIRLQRTGKQLDPLKTLQEVAIKHQDVLDIVPILEAG